VRHGRALAALANPGEQDAAVVARAVDGALAACPDSPLARTLRARLLEERGDDPGAVAAAWSEVLAVRPFRVEALMQLAYARLRAGDLEEARAEYERALALDPGHPGIRKNLRLLDVQAGELGAGREWLDGADPTAEECFARSKTVREQGDALLADLLEARAHLLWARQHAAGGRFGDAVRSYRQCVRVTREHVTGGAPRVRLELAAALAADGRDDEARAEIAGAAARDADRAALPPWAVAELGRLGLGG
jgi:Flp pilus assembly protein TadD